MILDYDKYMESPEWEAKKKQKFEEQDYICEECGKPAKTAHHLHYRTLGHESMKDLQALCWPCHNAKHPDKQVRKRMASRDATLKQARDWLLKYVEFGAVCPCCQQVAGIRKRNVNAQIARGLVEFLRWENDHPGEYHYFADVLNPIGYHGADYSKLKYWELLECDPDKRGRWRITERGRDFALGRLAITKYARIYDDRLLGFKGPPVFIKDCWDKKFDYDEMISGIPKEDD